jgi:hypothetical protein
MEEIPSVDLTSVIVSVASAVVEANRILSEGTETPMGITEFTITYQVHASLQIQELDARRLGLRLAESGMAVLDKSVLKAVKLRHFTTLTPKERILTGYMRDADLTITTRMEPLPKMA